MHPGSLQPSSNSIVVFEFRFYLQKWDSAVFYFLFISFYFARLFFTCPVLDHMSAHTTELYVSRPPSRFFFCFYVDIHLWTSSSEPHAFIFILFVFQRIISIYRGLQASLRAWWPENGWGFCELEGSAFGPKVWLWGHFALAVSFRVPCSQMPPNLADGRLGSVNSEPRYFHP